MKVLITWDSTEELDAALKLSDILKSTLIQHRLYGGSTDGNNPTGTVGVTLKKNAVQILNDIKEVE